jgi:hypothetical protein
MSLAPKERPVSSDCDVSNHCRPKRLKPAQQTEPMGLQYDGTKMLCRSATRENTDFNSDPASVDQRGDEPRTKL